MNSCLATSTIKLDVMLKKSMMKKDMFKGKKMQLLCRPKLED